MKRTSGDICSCRLSCYSMLCRAAMPPSGGSQWAASPSNARCAITVNPGQLHRKQATVEASFSLVCHFELTASLFSTAGTLGALLMSVHSHLSWQPAHKVARNSSIATWELGPTNRPLAISIVLQAIIMHSSKLLPQFIAQLLQSCLTVSPSFVSPLHVQS